MLELPPFDMPDEVMVEVLRNMTPVQRLTVGNNMWVSARRGIEYMLRSDHPDWDDEQVRREVARRMLRGTA
jgi:hypothetical protein